MPAVTLDELAHQLSAELIGDGSVTPTDVQFDSRRAHSGDLFACVPGASHDGHDFAVGAVDRGAVAVLTERALPVEVPQLVVASVRTAMATAAAIVHGHPSAELVLIGVTGTNGKTTVAYFLGAVLEAAGRSSRVVGTLGGTHTTPEAPDLQRLLRQYLDEGVDSVAMEVSSHALDLERVAAIRFDVSVFTMLGRDHLDFHGTPERYFAAKARLFGPDLSARAVLNIDAPHGRLLRDTVEIPAVTYSLDDVSDLAMDAHGSRFRWRGVDVQIALPGRHNVSNAVAALTAGAELGIAAEVSAAGVARVERVPGRFDMVPGSGDFAVVVDYSHTPDALAVAIGAAHELTAGRVIVVFGAGGDRDRQKRPEFGTVAATADLLIVTSDNPRSEDPATIIDEIVAGIPSEDRARSRVEPDRRQAIDLALREAGPGDLVLLAGKGHESTQTIGNDIVSFDDRQVAAELLARIQGGDR
ncbi:MAG: UDP-N-acetylmuramoyl-L-alanyl-D-glutamate--2,6-diaminopimelate ligase [Actinomycetia bacterium]|nr:UDP-N-acetylmuramoyl-L-alanyl-D-glutamate--2,6-diaminopimelate ligase [Actinomycetes bacterium]